MDSEEETDQTDEQEANPPVAPTVELDPLAGEEGGEKSRRLAAFWKKQIKQVDDENKKWFKRGNGVEKRYRDERTRAQEGDGNRRYNALWSNVEILYPAIFGRVPVPVAERKFRDKDPVGRGAAQILERGLRNEVEISDFGESIGAAVSDYLLPGRGVVWVRYEPAVEAGISLPVEDSLNMRDNEGQLEDEDDDVSEVKLEDTGDRVSRESTPVDHIYWTDFYTFPAKARKWKEVVTVGKKVYLTRDGLIKRFGEEIGKKVPLERVEDDRRGRNTYPQADDDDDQRAQVFELWCRSDETVYWVAEDYDFLLDRKDDPLKLANFFPVPKPLYANATNSTLIPVPDYMQYQDQATQIDELTQRIYMLTKACKMVGTYNAAEKDVARMFDEGIENQLLPVDDWAVFAEKGGVAGAVSFLPLKEVIGVINELTELKAKQIEEMDRLTGITDVLRGTTDGRESLGGQRLKQNNAGTRLQRRQNDVARLCRDTVRIMAEIMATHFTPQSLIEASGALQEEGLGLPDVVEGLANGPPQPPQQPPQQQLPPPQPQLQLPPPSGGGQPGGGPPPQALTPAPNGAAPPGNVIPFPGTPPPGGQFMGNPLGPQPQQTLPQQPTFPPEILAKIEGLKRVFAAIQLLRNEKLRGFRVDIEVDSTIFGDAAEEKAARTEFVGMVTKYLSEAGQMAMQMPSITPLLGKFLQFGVRGFRVGRDLEAAIEDFCDEAEKDAKIRAANPQPNPEQIKANAVMAAATAKIEGTKLTMTAQQQKFAADQQVRQQEAAQRAAEAEAEIRTAQIEAQSEAENRAAEIERQRVENEGDMRTAAITKQTEELRARMELAQLQLEYAELEDKRKQREHDATQADEQREHDKEMAKLQRETEKHKTKTAQAKAKASSAK